MFGWSKTLYPTKFLIYLFHTFNSCLQAQEQLYSYFVALCSLMAVTALPCLKQAQLSCLALGTYRHEGDMRVLLGERGHDLVHLSTLRSPWRPEVDNYEGPIKKKTAFIFTLELRSIKVGFATHTNARIFLRRKSTSQTENIFYSLRGIQPYCFFRNCTKTQRHC